MTHFVRQLTGNRVLVAILSVALLARLSVVNFGLPLLLINDEPPFILASLLMLKLRTLVPAWHLAEFSSVLYYPPYLSYLLLIPFTIITLIAKISFTGAPELFSHHLASDLSIYFLAARVLASLVGTATVYLVYAISESLFQNRSIALGSALLLAASPHHIIISGTARHWGAVAFVYAYAWYCLTNKNWSPEKRYSWAILTIGLSMGISPICILFLPLILLSFWYESAEDKRRLLTNYWLMATRATSFIALTLLPGYLYPRSNGFLVDLTWSKAKDISQLVLSPAPFLEFMLQAEPLLIIGIVTGSTILFWQKKRAVIAPVVATIYVYTFTFMLLFRADERFALPLFVLCAPIASYAIHTIYTHLSNKSAPISRLFLLVPTGIIVFSLTGTLHLALQNDTRIIATQWIQKNLPEHAKIASYIRLFRMRTTPKAIDELYAINKTALRSADRADQTLPTTNKTPHSLHLAQVSNYEILSRIPSYLKREQYEYLLYQYTYPKDSRVSELFDKLAFEGRVVEAFRGNNEHSIADSNIGRFWTLWGGPPSGPSFHLIHI